MFPMCHAFHCRPSVITNAPSHSASGSLLAPKVRSCTAWSCETMRVCVRIHAFAASRQDFCEDIFCEGFCVVVAVKAGKTTGASCNTILRFYPAGQRINLIKPNRDRAVRRWLRCFQLFACALHHSCAKPRSQGTESMKQ